MATPPDFVAGQVLTAAELNQIGAWRTKAETSFSAATSVTADNVFTTDFTNYRINLRFNTSTTNAVGMKLRVGGVSASTNYNLQFVQWSGNASVASAATGSTAFDLSGGSSTLWSYCFIELSGPRLAEVTTILAATYLSSGAYTTPQQQHRYGTHTTTTAYDGVEFFVASGTFTGSYTIYGWNQ